MSKKAVNKVVVDGVTRLDLTGDSVTPQTLLAGATAHNAAGEHIEGAVTVAPASDTVPLAPDDTGNAGTEGKYARGDHVHPRDATKQGKITVDGILQGDGEGNISAAEVQETEELDIPTGILKGTANGIEAAAAGADYAAAPTLRQITLTAAGWNSSTKQQTVTCSGVLADAAAQEIHVAPADASYDSVWRTCAVLCVAQGANSLTFQCDTIPTGDITVYVSIWTL